MSHTNIIYINVICIFICNIFILYYRLSNNTYIYIYYQVISYYILYVYVLIVHLSYNVGTSSPRPWSSSWARSSSTSGSRTSKLKFLHAHPVGIIYAILFLSGRHNLCVLIILQAFKFMFLDAHSADIIYASLRSPNC